MPFIIACVHLCVVARTGRDMLPNMLSVLPGAAVSCHVLPFTKKYMFVTHLTESMFTFAFKNPVFKVQDTCVPLLHR